MDRSKPRDCKFTVKRGRKPRTPPRSRVEPSPPPTADEQPSGSGAIRGIIRSSSGGRPIVGALVLLRCSCLGGVRQRFTDARGMYSFSDLPPGDYSVQVIQHRARVEKRFTLPDSERFWAHFAIDGLDEDLVILVPEPPEGGWPPPKPWE